MLRTKSRVRRDTFFRRTNKVLIDFEAESERLLSSNFDSIEPKADSNKKEYHLAKKHSEYLRRLESWSTQNIQKQGDNPALNAYHSALEKYSKTLSQLLNVRIRPGDASTLELQGYRKSLRTNLGLLRSKHNSLNEFYLTQPPVLRVLEKEVLWMFVGLLFLSFAWFCRGFVQHKKLLSPASLERLSTQRSLYDQAPRETASFLTQVHEKVSKNKSELQHKLDENENSLAQIRNFTNDVLRSMPVGLIVLGENDRIVRINAAAKQYFPELLKAKVGDTLTTFLNPELLLPVASNVPQNEGGESNSPSHVREFHGRFFNVLTERLRERDGTRGDDSLILIQDVSERERTKDRLVVSERMATMGRLGAQITHEIRNPLSSIGLNIDLLTDDVSELPVERREECQHILNAVQEEVLRLSEITEGYLRLARFRNTAEGDDRIDQLLADLYAFMQSDARSKGVRIELRLPAELPPRQHSKQRLRQAVMNLVRNGIEAAGKGGSVVLSASHRDKTIVIGVSDTGAGVPEELQERIFKPFFTTKDSGTGIGLSLTQEIVKEHGGQMKLANAPIGGALFEITLPLAG